MSEATRCPDLATLSAHARDYLGPKESAAVDRHLAGCRDCLDRFLQRESRSLTPDIPNCHIVKEIGRGRFGVVYKAWWLVDDPRIVALKVLSGVGEMEIGRFDREIAVLKKLDSAGIVRCLDSGTAGDAHFFVMDYIDGVTLDVFLDSTRGDRDRQLAVFQRICHAVADAHACGVVHRDLKPGNILIDTGDNPHVLDFGICSVAATDWSSWDRHTITHMGDLIGTLKYMSPEQAWGGVAKPIDQRTDIWALGIMLYGIATDGGYPYSLRSTPDKPAHEALLERIRKELPKLVRLGDVERGRDIEILLERCLAWEPEHRLDSAKMLADDLARYGRGQRIKTKPLRLSYRLERLAVGAATRSRWAFSATYIAAVAVLLSVSVYQFGAGWHVTGREYQASVHPASALGGAGPVRDAMLIIGVGDDTIDAVVALARDQGLSGVTADMRSWRGVHGRLMERLAGAGPRAVVWDYYFRSAQPGDAQLVAGITALEQAGVPVILASNRYDDDGSPDLSPNLTGPLAGRLRHGSIKARDLVKRPGEFVIASKREDGRAVPNVALVVLASLLHPDARLELDWRGRENQLSMLYRMPAQTFLRERDRIELNMVFKAGRDDHGIRAGDLLASSTLALEEPDRWERRTVAYERLLAGTDQELQTLVGGKVLVIGDMRTRWSVRAPDRHRVKYGTRIIDDVPGCYLLADAIANLLEGRYIKLARPLSPATFLIMLMVAAIGCLVPMKVAAGRSLELPGRRAMVLALLATLSTLAFLVMILTRSVVAVHAGMAGLSLLAPMAGSFWVEFARSRHRVLDRRRRAIDGFGVSPGGTLTVAPQPRKSSREATR